MVDEVLKAVAERKIQELEREIDKLRMELRDKQSFHSAAWAEYGSELCVGGMVADENAIHENITSVSRKVALLRRFINWDLDISREDWLNKCSVEAAGKIVTLQDAKKLIDEELLEITMFKSLLAITF